MPSRECVMPSTDSAHPRLFRRRRALLAVPLAAILVTLVATAAAAQDDGAVTEEGDRAVPERGADGIVFQDAVDRGHGDAVHALANEGIVQGCDEDRFCPTDVLTRGQMASMLVAALDLVPIVDGPFTDLDGSVHEQQINALAAVGVVSGCDDGAFCASDPLTRGQLATMLVRAFEVPPTSIRSFDDTSTIHGDSIDRLAAAGIAAGCGDPLTHFCGTDTVNREQTATFLARAMGLVPTVEIAPLEQRRAEQAAIDAERAAEAARQAELEAQRQAELEAERRAAERLAMWERLAQCESGGNWRINTGNGYYGGLQFLLQTWRYVGGSGYPHQASKAEQIYRAERLLEYSWATFSNQWPACSRRLGLS